MEPDNSTTSVSSNGSTRSMTINEVTSEPTAAASLLLLPPQVGAEVLDTPRKQRRKRLRRLAAGDEQLENAGQLAKPDAGFWRRLAVGTLLIALSLAAIVGHLQYGRHTAQSHLLQHFMSSYRKHYNQIVHGRVDYCSLQLDTQALFARIRLQPPTLLHQDRALQQLELALRNDSNAANKAGHFNAVAVVGPVGVGKSLWARALEQHFPWRENVHTYAWNTFVPDEIEKFRVVRMFAEGLSDCGLNLLVIENLTPCDAEVVNIVNRLIAEGEGDVVSNKRVLVIYIFNLNTMEPPEEQERHHDMLQQLPRTKTVNFRAFGAQELRDCIILEASTEGLKLSAGDFAKIVESIDAARSGCKNVHAKVLAYGTRDKAV